MKNLIGYDIDNAEHVLESAINAKKLQMQNASSTYSHAPVASYVFSEIMKKASGTYPQMNDALERGGKIAQDFLMKTQESIKENPWGAVRKIAVSSFAIGLFLSLRRRKTSTEEKE